ncbi:MAG TPA: hypothetical protein VK750_04925 [Cytophagaceae bacterium]|jgi:hypothetical protein|nr:hypothetical protein [Cytophagaceae bacterium]
MKKVIFVLAVLVMSAQQLAAQLLINEKRHFVSTNLGISNPTGAYADKSAANDDAGLAKTGISGFVEAAYYIKPFFGIGGTIGSFSNKVDKSALQDQLTSELKASGFNGTYSINSSGWANVYVMVGPYFSLPLKKVTLDFKIVGGGMTSIAPVVNESYTPYSNPYATTTIKTEVAVGGGFSYGMGLSLRYHFKPRWALRLNADYISSQVSIDQTLDTETSSGTTSTTNTIHQSISTLNIGVGVAFQFIKK